MGNLRNVYRYTRGGKAISGGGVTDGFIFNRPDGADAFLSNAESIDNVSGIGSKPVFLRLSPRTITQEGWILRDKEVLGDLLQEVFSPLQVVELEATRPDFSKWWLDCTVTQTPDIAESWSKPRFQVLLTAYYPLWRSRKESSKTLTAGNNTVPVGGQGPTAFRLTASSASGALTIRDTATGESLSYSGGGSGALTIEVDVNGRITAKAGSADVIGKVSGNLKALQPGSRTINASAACTLTWREVRLGV